MAQVVLVKIKYLCIIIIIAHSVDVYRHNRDVSLIWILFFMSSNWATAQKRQQGNINKAFRDDIVKERPLQP